MSEIVQRAEEYARHAHQSIDQRRKYTGRPYIVHPQAVAKTVASVTDDPATIAAAWLHDVVEDTPITIEQIEQEFGEDIATLVSDLTNTTTLKDGNRSRRKALDRERIAGADPRAKTVKLADLIDNLSDILVADPGFARKYFAEKESQLQVLKEGDQRLFVQVEKIIKEGKRQLGE